MVRVTTILVGLVLFVILLTVSLLILSGIVPTFREGVSNAACGILKICG